ncbi:hypothetical protein [Pendulispora albinea]|uniref:Uncharacterized protein n=1 Tax=Pendulispora albinea TaxID=2741071 RepID=A0ABZ2M834_9BACT
MMSTRDEPQRTVTLGPEYDEATRNALEETLVALGASHLGGSWGIGGSQELETAIVVLRGRELRIEVETYIGISIVGDDDLVTIVANGVADRLGRR